MNSSCGRGIAWFAVVLLACGSDDGSAGSSETESGTGGPGSGSASMTSSTTGASTTQQTNSGSGSSASESASTGDSASGTGGGPVLTCMAGAVPGGGEVDPEEQKQVMGDDGTSADHCDRDGNLVEVLCESVTECGPGPNPECTTTQTGNTATLEFDCNGTCEDGTCEARCPDFGDEVEYTATGDPVTLQNNVDGRVYSCVLVFDQMNDTYDCAADPVVGETTTIQALGLSGLFCTGGEFGNIQTATGCSYTCTLL